MSDIQSLDDIMSGRGNPNSDVSEKEPTSTVADASAPSSQGRDDKGRFANRQEPTAEPSATAPTPAADPTATGDAPGGTAPIQALDAERRRRKDTEERYEREMRELRDQIARLQPAKPAEPAAPPPSLWDDPDQYLQSQLTPVQHQMLEMREMMSENMAVTAHGAETVNAAKSALEQIAATPQGQNIVQALIKSRHPFDDLVKWHKRQSSISEVGDDPEAYFQRRLAAWQAAQTQGGQPAPSTQAPTPAAEPAQMPPAFAKAPSGGPRGGPEYGGPRPLSEIMKR